MFFLPGNILYLTLLLPFLMYIFYWRSMVTPKAKAQNLQVEVSNIPIRAAITIYNQRDATGMYKSFSDSLSCLPLYMVQERVYKL